jgi:LacI family transcriptional regulator
MTQQSTGKRPTIRDLADMAGVSVATVNRVLSGSASVRPATMERVLEAAETIGFYASSAIKGRIIAARPKYRLGVLLLQRKRSFYRAVAESLQTAAAAIIDCDVELHIDYLEDLSPEYVAEQMMRLAEKADCMAVVSAEHPIITDTIEKLADQGVPVFGLISPLSTRHSAGYIGIESWKVGRTAAWFFDHTCPESGELGILMGSHRYRCQELNESGFRSYFREHNRGFSLLEPRTTFESSTNAREITEELLRTHPNMVGLFISGGGITGALAALRANPRAKGITAVGYELIDVTKAALLDGTLTAVLAHPIKTLAEQTIELMIRHLSAGPESGRHSMILPFDIYTRENL